MTWKTALLVLVALLAGIAVVFNIATRTPAPPQHQVYINGDVLTMDENNQIAEAISVRAGLIEKVGSSDEILAGVTDSTEVIDLHGRTLLPGFIDAHGHFPGSGLTSISADLNSPPIGDKANMAEVLDSLREEAAKRAPGEWVAGWGYDDTLLAEMRHPTREELDSVSTEHPVAAVHVSGHMLVANSLALEMAGIDESTPNPEGGVIVKDPASGKLTGLLEETATYPVRTPMMDFGFSDIFTMMKSAAQEYAQVGVTTAQSGGISPALGKGLVLFSRFGIIPMRVLVFPFETEFGETLLNGEFDPSSYSGDRVEVGPVKLVADGSIQGYTGYLGHPYHEPFKGDETYRGYPAIPRDVLFDKVEKLHKAGYHLAIHGNGDESIEDILDAFEAAQQVYPVEDPRMILIHSQMAREDQVARMKALGVTPSFFTAHTWYWGDRHRDIFMGPERAAAMSPSRWAQDYDVRFSSHLDTPVTPMLPLQAVWSSVHRITYGGDTLGEDQRIDVMDALRAVTIDAAYQIFQDDNRGSLEPGKYADLVVLSGSPLSDPMAMRDLKVERTVVGGVTIYRRQ